jgi:hypothetical protein
LHCCPSGQVSTAALPFDYSGGSIMASRSLRPSALSCPAISSTLMMMSLAISHASSLGDMSMSPCNSQTSSSHVRIPSAKNSAERSRTLSAHCLDVSS